jgi:Ca2+/Na+ antiporter
MFEVLLTLVAVGIFLFLVIKGVVSIVRGVMLLFLAFLAYYLILSYPPNSSSEYSQRLFGNFLKAPADTIKNIFYDLEISNVTKYDDKLIIFVKNEGILPLYGFNVKIDDKDVEIIKNIIILLPSREGSIEVKWKENNYYKIEIVASGAKDTYISPL